MLSRYSNVNDIKHEVLLRVSQLAFEGTLEEKRDEIPYEFIPGHKPTFRCCVYKEREIIRQRIRLAEGKFPLEGKENRSIIQVLDTACAGCSIQRFAVSDNCQKCMSKSCMSTCPFGAISPGKHQAYIDPDKCRECGKCVQACPYNAIIDRQRPCKKSCPTNAISMDENNIVVINEEKCIHCGECIKTCPFGALSAKSYVVQVINAIKAGKPVYAMVAPAIDGQFGADVTMSDLRDALIELGFTDMYEVALGADFTAKAESEEWYEAYKAGEKKTTSCCPAFVSMVRKHFPQLSDCISTTVSPMVATSRYIKGLHPDAVTVFIGPCIAKKSEVLLEDIEGNADYAMSMRELVALFEAKKVEIKSSGANSQQGSLFGHRFAMSGGVTNAVLAALKEKGIEEEISVHCANGIKECKKALTQMKTGKLPYDFLEGMACEGGCVNGPRGLISGLEHKKNRDVLEENMDKRTILDNVESHSTSCTVEMHR